MRPGLFNILWMLLEENRVQGQPRWSLTGSDCRRRSTHRTPNTRLVTERVLLLFFPLQLFTVVTRGYIWSMFLLSNDQQRSLSCVPFTSKYKIKRITTGIALLEYFQDENPLSAFCTWVCVGGRICLFNIDFFLQCRGSIDQYVQKGMGGRERDGKNNL